MNRKYLLLICLALTGCGQPGTYQLAESREGTFLVNTTNGEARKLESESSQYYWEPIMTTKPTVPAEPAPAQSTTVQPAANLTAQQRKDIFDKAAEQEAKDMHEMDQYTSSGQ